MTESHGNSPKSKDFGRCNRCNRPLKSLQSIEIGYGPTCYKKFLQESNLYKLFEVNKEEE